MNTQINSNNQTNNTVGSTHTRSSNSPVIESIIADVAEYAAKFGVKFSDAEMVFNICGHDRIKRQISNIPMCS